MEGAKELGTGSGTPARSMGEGRWGCREEEEEEEEETAAFGPQGFPATSSHPWQAQLLERVCACEVAPTKEVNSP